MNKLLSYLNSINVPDQQAFACFCATSIGYLRKACSINQKLSAMTCVAIEKATSGAVTRKDLRPDDWHLIWPELAEKKVA